jgi:hypothetical protein
MNKYQKGIFAILALAIFILKAPASEIHDAVRARTDTVVADWAIPGS